MQVIGFFGDVLEQMGNLWRFVTEPLDIFEKLGFENVSILSLLSVSLVALLLAGLVLHIIHLVNPVG